MTVNLPELRWRLTAPVRRLQSWWTARRSQDWQHVTDERLVAQLSPMTPASRRLRNFKIIRFAAIALFVMVVVGVITFFGLFAWVSKDLPRPGQIVRKEGFSTKIFDRNGKLLTDLFSDERREPVTFDQIPVTLRQATVAIEDKDFYKHGGFDPLTPFRIVFNYIFRQGRVVGGSTLTQQLVKTVLLTNERSVIRKFKEFVLALQIERTFTKDQILEMYLNEAPYGGNSAGVGAASLQYFGKPVSQVNLVESAILAGLPQRPTAYSPQLNKKDIDGTPLWKERTFGVLRRMNEDGYINKDQYQQAVKDLDTVQFQSSISQNNAPHFVLYVRDILEKQFGQDVVARGGLQVTTSLDLDIQNKAQATVKDELAKVKTLNITNGSAMVLNPKTGEILTMIGSADFNDPEIDGQFNVAVDGLRQPGSSIKPVTYLGMLRKGYTPATMLIDVDTVFQRNEAEPKYEPNNYDGKFRGPLSLRNSLGNSMNINSVKSLALVGIDNFLDLAFQMGFPTLENTPANMKRFGLAVTLGGAEVHLIDSVSAYSAFANGGTKVDPVAILKVTDNDGHVLYEFHPVEGPRVMSPEEAFLIDSILSDNTARQLAFGANSLLNTGKPIAVKTGTTNDKKDNWAIGWSQDFVVGVWVGNSNNSAMKQVASGVSGASPIWRKIVNDLLAAGYKAPEWQVPAGVEQVNVDNISGYPAHDGYPEHKEYVIKGTLPALPDPVHAKVKVCRSDNHKLATDAMVASGDYDEKEFIVLHEEDPFSQDGVNRWQQGIDAWVSSQSDEKYKAPSEFCGSNSDVFVRLAKPSDQTKFDSQDIEVKIESDSGDGIEKLELWVDNGLKESINGSSYTGTIHLNSGRHEIYAKAFSRSGKSAQSGTARIGTGGQDWQPPAPSPTPSPTPAPSPTPTPTPSPSPLIPLP